MIALVRRGALLSALVPAVAAAQQAAPLPLKHAPKPTVAEITAADLMTRLYIFADDSMMGREAGTPGNRKGADYIAAELKKLGLKPAGENGDFLQVVPLVKRAVDGDATKLQVDGGDALAWGTDFLFTAIGEPKPFANTPVVFGGAFGDSAGISPDAVQGKLVVFSPPKAGPMMGMRQQMAALGRYTGAVAVAIVAPIPAFPPQMANAARTPRIMLPGTPMAEGLPTAIINLTAGAAAKLLGMPVESMGVGMSHTTVSGALVQKDEPAPAYNVAAILEGGDKKLKGEFIAIGGHNDHVGVGQVAVDHDSLHAVNKAIWWWRENNDAKQPTQAVRDSIAKAVVATLKSSGRRDSIRNGADDDGSGSMGVLEVAEKFAKTKARPKRSILFLWYTGEEKGLLGSRYFTDHPTVPRDSVVSAINIDMIGRGGAEDIKNHGGDQYLQLVGSRRLSTEMGDLIESLNAKRKSPFFFDYTFDANGHPENIYCRSDHYNWARYGVPVTFFTTGLHGDYHQVTDEPQYIDYPHYAAVTGFVYDVALNLANRDKNVVVDKPKPDPNGVCRQ